MPQRLTANEIGNLWTQNFQAGMSIRILLYFLETVEDEEVKARIQQAYNISIMIHEQTHLLLETNDIPLPIGFSERDVDLKAPKLFSDPLMLNFIENMGKAGVLAHSLSLASCSSQEIRSLFTAVLRGTTELFNATVETAFSKGWFISPPQIEIEKETELVRSKRYLSPIQKRTLNTIEITHLFENVKNNALGELLCTGFAQTTQSKKIQQFMLKGRNISNKHIRLFTKIFNEANLHPPMGSESFVTQSITAPFSDKLILALISVLTSTGHGNYSTASSASLRYDLVLLYQKLSIEIGLFAKDGMDLMIKHNWLEEPPQLINRSKIFNLRQE
ncbi:DUF3231 family protein [Halobacillus sp. Marseille-P3879]|uniref:DUF3231 family protein n=1 Tax=Halobacillus sp. Marseille-P3879 TaxID=2045014 RepID=UPI001357593E|nr:DUF3231 family protein [Halobacillus sp. Marseille-P3879]